MRLGCRKTDEDFQTDYIDWKFIVIVIVNKETAKEEDDLKVKVVADTEPSDSWASAGTESASKWKKSLSLCDHMQLLIVKRMCD